MMDFNDWMKKLSEDGTHVTVTFLDSDEIFADSEEAFTFFDVPETKFAEIWESPIVQQAHLEPTKDHIVPRSLGMDMLLISAETFGLVSKRVHPKLNAYIVRAKCRPYTRPFRRPERTDP